MKKYFLAALAIIVTTGINAVVPTFKSVSVLSSGKWVKIKVGETGVYQLDYDQLREFGFEYPETPEPIINSVSLLALLTFTVPQ